MVFGRMPFALLLRECRFAADAFLIQLQLRTDGA